MINKNKKIMKMILEKNKKVSMGNRSGLGFLDDPVRLTFTLSRYKFVAKMFEGFNNVLEIGAGDGFKSPIVGQFCKKLTWRRRRKAGTPIRRRRMMTRQMKEDRTGS